MPKAHRTLDAVAPRAPGRHAGKPWRRILPAAGVLGVAPPLAVFGARQAGTVDLGLNPIILGAALWITFVMVVAGAMLVLLERRSPA